MGPSAHEPRTERTGLLLVISAILFQRCNLLCMYICIQESSQMVPHWPPIQATVDGGQSPTFGHLMKSIKAALTQSHVCGPTVPENLLVFKFLPGTYTWTQLLSNASTGKKKLENICAKPYELKEGDLVCVCDENRLSCPQTSDHKYDSIRICRSEDRLYQLLAAEKKKNKKSKRGNEDFYSSTGTTGNHAAKKRANIIEQALSLGGDLNFSDDEADDNDAASDAVSTSTA
jgi:hypothetical protein